ncbi:hypothetical protein [Candidatus Nephthysia bennettiae]|uniref:Uncharacterized protein n=1 Tax=Candidatus Nephthysia bennettiae TaxID=3127016 RepID=A0A934N9M0_9BACT|nr:hypothetical protein [Candidatus Dormibacteraeota bacterium]
MTFEGRPALIGHSRLGYGYRGRIYVRSREGWLAVWDCPHVGEHASVAEAEICAREHAAEHP